LRATTKIIDTNSTYTAIISNTTSRGYTHCIHSHRTLVRTRKHLLQMPAK